MHTLRSSTVEASAWDSILLEPISSASARALLKVQFSEKDHERMKHLSAKARIGRLTADERRQIDAFEELGCLLDVLHSKARRALSRSKTAS